jgi:hypothetical protein
VKHGVDVNKAARMYNVSNSTWRGYNMEKVITSVVSIGYPMELPNVVE